MPEIEDVVCSSITTLATVFYIVSIWQYSDNILMNAKRYRGSVRTSSVISYSKSIPLRSRVLYLLVYIPVNLNANLMLYTQ
jgi:hypothetical protein